MIVSICRILFPTDFSEPAAEAQQYSMALADRLGAELHVLHVIEPPAVPFPDSSTSWTMPGTHMKSQLHEAEERLQKEMGSSPEERRTVSAVKVGFAVDEIMKYAEEHTIDLIVVGTHGLTGIVHLLNGSVAEKLVRIATCPVLTVRPLGHQFLIDSSHLAETAQA